MQISFSELDQYFFTISDFFVTKQTGRGSTRFTMQNPRHTDAFLYFAKTTGVCYQRGEQPLYVPQGSLLYLPKNSRYVWENSPAPGYKIQENILFEFTLNKIDVERDKSEKNKFMCSDSVGERISFSDKVCIVSAHRPAQYKQLIYTMLDVFKGNSSPLPIYSAAFDFFNVVSSNCRIEENSGADVSIIRKSIKDLEEYSTASKSIKEIANECNVSIGYYERLFRNYSGISPMEYRNIHRINMIKMFLQNTETTLDEIAEKMGYCDSGYLCRIFKNKTGMTPKEYRKIYISQTCRNSIKRK